MPATPAPDLMPTRSADTAVVLDRREGPFGEVVLRERGEHFEIIANGCFLMDTSDGRSERLLIDAALAALPAGRSGPSVLIGGLGVGFSLVRAAEERRWGRIVVVEREQAIVDWHLAGPLDRISVQPWPTPGPGSCTRTSSPTSVPPRSVTTHCAWTSTTGRTGPSRRTTEASTPPPAWRTATTG